MAFSADELVPLPDLDVPEGVTSIGRTIVIKGDVQADEHLIVEGQVEGRLMVPEHGLAIGKHGRVSSEMLARTITVLGQADGKLTATERVELLKSGRVSGRIVTASLIIDEGRRFQRRRRPHSCRHGHGREPSPSQAAEGRGLATACEGPAPRAQTRCARSWRASTLRTD